MAMSNVLINPSEMNEEELQELITKTEKEKQILIEEEKQVYKNIRGKLWIWWIFPIFGWVVYYHIFEKRKTDPMNDQQLTAVKKKIAEKEIQELFNKKRLEELKK